MSAIDRMQETCSDWSLTLLRHADATDRLRKTITEAEVARIFVDTFAKEAFVTTDDFGLRLYGRDEIEDFGIYTAIIHMRGGALIPVTLWVVPARDGEPQGVEFTQRPKHTHLTKLTPEQCGAIAYAIGRLDGTADNFGRRCISHLKSLVLGSEHAAD